MIMIIYYYYFFKKIINVKMSQSATEKTHKTGNDFIERTSADSESRQINLLEYQINLTFYDKVSSGCKMSHGV